MSGAVRTQLPSANAQLVTTYCSREGANIDTEVVSALARAELTNEQVQAIIAELVPAKKPVETAPPKPSAADTFTNAMGTAMHKTGAAIGSMAKATGRILEATDLENYGRVASRSKDALLGAIGHNAITMAVSIATLVPDSSQLNMAGYWTAGIYGVMNLFRSVTANDNNHGAKVMTPIANAVKTAGLAALDAMSPAIGPALNMAAVAKDGIDILRHASRLPSE